MVFDIKQGDDYSQKEIDRLNGELAAIKTKIRLMANVINTGHGDIVVVDYRELKKWLLELAND